MKNKIISFIGLIAAFIAIITSVIYFVRGIAIPGLAPFSLSILMIILVYNTRQRYNDGKVNKTHWSNILIIGTSAGVLNGIVAILQLVRL
jgi:hypothetical protein